MERKAKSNPWFGRTHWSNYSTAKEARDLRLTWPQPSMRWRNSITAETHAKQRSRRPGAGRLLGDLDAGMAYTRDISPGVTIPTAHTSALLQSTSGCDITHPRVGRPEVATSSAGNAPKRTPPVYRDYNLDSFTKAVLNKLATNQPLQTRGARTRIYSVPEPKAGRDRKQTSEQPARESPRRARPHSPKDALHTWSFTPDLSSGDAPLRVARNAGHSHRNTSKVTLDERENQWRYKVEMDALADDPISWRLKHVIHADAETNDRPLPVAPNKRLHSAKLFDFDVTTTNENELQRLHRDIDGENSWLSYIKDETAKSRHQHDHTHYVKHKPRVPLPLSDTASVKNNSRVVNIDHAEPTKINFDDPKLEMIHNFLQDVQNGQSSESNSAQPKRTSKHQRLPLFGIKLDGDVTPQDETPTEESASEDKEGFTEINTHHLKETSAGEPTEKKGKSAAKRSYERRGPSIAVRPIGTKALDPKAAKLDDVITRIGIRPVPEEHLVKYFKYVEQFVVAHLGDNNATVSAADIVNAEKFFGNLSHMTTSQLPHSRLLTLLGEKKKQLLAEDKQKKPTLLESIKTPDRTSESVGRAGLTYTAPDTAQQKTQDHQARKAFVTSYLSTLAKEATAADQRQVAVRQAWSQILAEMVHHLVAEMWDSKTYMKRCLDEIENS